MEKKALPAGDQQEAKDSPPKVPRRRRRRRRWGFAAVFSLAVACLVFFVLSLSLSGRTVPLPEMFRAKFEASINERIQGAPFRLGQIEFGIDRRGVPQILMNNILLADQAGGAVAQLNWLGAEIALDRLVRREFAAEKVFLTGAQITVRRTTDGRFALASGSALGTSEQSISDILTAVDVAMTDGALSALSEVVAAGIVLTLEDARSGRIWQATNASAVLRKTQSGLSLSVTSDVFNGSDNLAGLQVSLIRSRETEHVQLGVTVDDMPAEDIAQQSPVLSWLGLLDAPISGSVRTELDEAGALIQFAGTLDISGGALQPAETIPPVAFDAAKAYFTFDPGRQRIDFSEVSFQAEAGAGVATGHTYLSDFNGAWPSAYISQFHLEDLTYGGGIALDGPVTLEDVRADFRVKLNPFTVDFGQLSIDNSGTPVSATGRISGDETGWHVAFDATTPEIGGERVLAFWPSRVAPITRGWLSQNFRSGKLYNPALGLRFNSGSKPDLSLSFEFDDGTVRFLPEMPFLEGAAGRAELHDHRFSLTLDKGQVTGPNGKPVDAAGSVFTVIDTRPKPSLGEIAVKASGRLDTILGVLNRPPLRLIDRAKRPIDIAEADVDVDALISLPLRAGLTADDIGFSVEADLSNVASEELVTGRVFTASSLRFDASPSVLKLSGLVELDGVPLSANWRQPLGAEARNGSEITGQVALSQDTLSAFDVPLLNGFLDGRAQADFTLSIPFDRELAPELQLRSNLLGLAMQLDGLGVEKPPEEAGEIELRARLGDEPVVERLALKTRDLTFDGSLTLEEDGRLERIELDELSLGDWLNADVELTPVPGGAPQIAVTGGTLDLREMQLPTNASGAGNTVTPIQLRLDQLIVSDGIAFRPFRGRIQVAPGGLSGSFDARVNGQTPIRGQLTPANAGTAIRLFSSNAAGVLRDAGLTPNAREGVLDLVLTPVNNAPSGTFDGQFLIEDIRLKDAPAMAELLDAVSIVGLLDELGGSGIRFDTIDGQFRMDRREIRLRQAAAVGPSIGISADGLFNVRSKQMDVRGVVSPVYFLNGIGSLFTRRGEGLFGFNYRMAGAANAPSVRVNPLSILTPGAFRQIFRSAPPGG